jgi:hypothetical protein
MHAYGEGHTGHSCEGHDDRCGICHPKQKNLKKKARRAAKSEVARLAAEHRARVEVERKTAEYWARLEKKASSFVALTKLLADASRC